MKIETPYFINKKDYVILAFMTGVAFLLSALPFVSIASVIIQLFIFLVMVIFFSRRPIYFLIVYQFFLITLKNILETKSEREVVAINYEGYYLNYAVVLTLFIFYLFSELIKRNNKVKLNTPMFFLSVLIFLSMIWAKTEVFYTYELFCLLLLYVGAHNFIKSDYDIRLLLFSTLLNGALYSIVSLPYLLNFSKEIINNMVLDTNYASLYCVVIVAVGYICLLIYNDLLSFKLKLFIFSIIITLGVVIVITMSRSGIILYFSCLIYYLFKIRGAQTKNIFYLGLISGGLLIFLNTEEYYIYWDNALDRFTLDDVNTMNGRTDIAGSYINQFLENDIYLQLMGNGYYSTFVTHIAPHNSFIAILSFFGVFGSILFILYLFELYKIIQKTRYRPFELLLIIFTIFGLTLETFNFQILVLLLTILFVVRKLESSKQIG